MLEQERITERLVARRPQPTDRAGYRAVLLDPRVEPRLRPAGAEPMGEQGAADRLAADEEHWDDHGFGPWALIEREGGSMVGRGGLQWTDVDGRLEVELPWTIASEHWNRGYATEAARAALDRAAELGFEEVVALITPQNLSSRRVAEKLGMREAGQATHGGLPHIVYRSGPD